MKSKSSRKKQRKKWRAQRAFLFTCIIAKLTNNLLILLLLRQQQVLALVSLAPNALGLLATLRTKIILLVLIAEVVLYL